MRNRRAAIKIKRLPETHMGLARKTAVGMAAKYGMGDDIDMIDDFTSAGYEGLCDAAADGGYRPDMGEFTTYAKGKVRKCIQKEMVQYGFNPPDRWNWKIKQSVKADTVGDEYWRYPGVADKQDEDMFVVDDICIKANLSGRETSVVKRRIFKGDSFKDIADDIGVTRERVRQIYNMSLRRMRFIVSS
ncbi:MAG: hypothetical protein GY847_14520 [Proteobacteria bacterium]|nr:hypothetical protein [Pseudomonadota bacterium]